LPIGIYRSTAGGPIIDANPMFVRMLGYPDRKTLLARRAADLYVDPKVRARWLAKLERSGVVTDFESQLYRFDGTTIWVRASARAVRPPEGGAAYLEGAIVDITDRKLAEAARARRTEELQAFYDLSRRLRAAHGADEIYPVIVEHARSLLDGYHGCLALLNAEHQVFARVHTTGIVGEKIGSTFPARGTRSGYVAAEGTPFVSLDFSRERLPEWMDAIPYRALGPLAIVPVRSDEGVIGTLCVGRVKGSDSPAFTDTELRLLVGAAEIAGIAIQRARLHQHLQDANVQMVVSLVHVMESRDEYTARHSRRVVALAVRVAREFGCSDQDVRDIRWAARLHDIGKVGVPDALLRKPAALTEQEWTVMRQHPLLGEEILSSVQRMCGAAKLVRHHQEAWNGTGYPDGLNGEAIPLGARILAVVDAFGAITEARPYRPARPHAEAVAEIKRCAGSQFDPRVVAAFCAVVEQRYGDAAGNP
ncbi:MAG TPA: HD domain-containing phosphohydrolase, partial [bacterium]|nr:HD domain-containing phosphohydrolase [bacterium]